jgi:hypothetical protein
MSFLTLKLAVMKKILKINHLLKLSFINYNENLYLSIEDRAKKVFPFFMRVPKSIRLHISDNSIEIQSVIYSELTSFIKRLEILQDSGIYTTHKKTLILKGLGYKMTLSDNFLFLKLGTSHINKILVPESINILISKNFLLVESIDKIALGHFVSHIKHLRKVDVYKNKGFKYKYFNERMKQVKKSK